MRKLIWLMHVSLDGYVGGPNREINFVSLSQEIFDDGHEVIATGDTAVYGRVTFGMMEAYWPTAAQRPNATKHDKEHAAWANAATKLVFSTTVTSSSWAGCRFLPGDAPGEIAREKAKPGKNLILLGSPSLASTLLDHGLIDEFYFNVNPVVLGGGLRLVRDRSQLTKLALIDSKAYDNGVVRLRYRKA